MANHDHNTRKNKVSNDKLEAFEDRIQSSIADLKDEFINMKNIIIKNLQMENTKLKNEINLMKNKIVDLEISNNSLDQYGRRNNLEIEGIPDNISDENLEKTAVKLLNAIDVDIKESEVEACHRLGKSKKGKSKRTIIRVVNRKYCKKALINRRQLLTVEDDEFEFQVANNVYIKENLTNYNSKLLYYCRKLRRASLINKEYTRDGIVNIVKSLHDKPIRVLHANELINLFPNFKFEDDVNPNLR